MHESCPNVSTESDPCTLATMTPTSLCEEPAALNAVPQEPLSMQRFRPFYPVRTPFYSVVLREHAGAACVHGVVHDGWWIDGGWVARWVSTISGGWVEGNPAPASWISTSWISTFRHVHPHEPPRGGGSGSSSSGAFGTRVTDSGRKQLLDPVGLWVPCWFVGPPRP